MRLDPSWPDQLDNPVANLATLDDILVQNANRNGDATALFRPDGGALTWREADAAAAALAAVITEWRLGEDAVVGVQLGSSLEGAISCLAVWRAGLIPAMLPLAWRRRELSTALSSVGASAVLTLSRGGGAALAEIACEVAADLYAIRYVGCFGGDPPDGATPLDDVLVPSLNAAERQLRPTDDARNVAVVTFDAGHVPVARSHSELLAAALGPLVASRLSAQSALVSTLDLAGLGGLAVGLAPWIASGCAARFLQPSDTAGFAETLRDVEATHLVAPGRLAGRMAGDAAFDPSALEAVSLVWRAPDGRSAPVDLGTDVATIDVSLFGELGLYAAARAQPARFAALPVGEAGPEAFPPLIELRIGRDGRLAVRGPACPSAPFPAAPEAPRIAFDDDGFLETGLAGFADRTANRLSLGGRRRGVVQVGGLPLSIDDLDEAYRRAGVRTAPHAEDDPLFGARVALAAGAGEPSLESVATLLEAAGFGPALAPIEAAAQPVRRTA
ncbi:AMP-binding protein [Methylopila sp. M107]|uniref:AMP-binding protein n=1 Tax=Methylopila sp. M107 TaxID=1101190 RepID=UPI0003A13E79|nr:AMP-binding protein [Methylopila sp. M107]